MYSATSSKVLSVSSGLLALSHNSRFPHLKGVNQDKTVVVLGIPPLDLAEAAVKVAIAKIRTNQIRTLPTWFSLDTDAPNLLELMIIEKT